VLVIEDLTELLNAQRASAWQEVARRMAHEIKNPLTPIQLSAERIAKRFAQSVHRSSIGGALPTSLPKSNAGGADQTAKVIREGTQTILREVDSLKAMVDEFSQFARLPNAKLENENVNDVIEQAIALYEDRLDGVRLTIELAENLPNAMLDDEQLRRVFVNLIENAVEAFDESQADKQIFVRTRHDEKYDLIIAEIADNGSGIRPADYQKLFQPYFSTKDRGTGLGLAIVQRIVIEHGGRIRAQANVPKGAKFILELPVIL
jgi:nitrogen fixation/metabolism regulation signal transduction histidine kinase